MTQFLSPGRRAHLKALVSWTLSFLLCTTPMASTAAAIKRPLATQSRKTAQTKHPQVDSDKGANALAEAFFVNPFAAGVTATKTDAFPSHPSGQAEPGDSIDYTVDVNNPTSFEATGMQFADTIDANTTLVAGSLKVSPLGLNDTYAAVINTQLVVGAPGVLSNDTGSPAPTALPVAAGPTTQGGTVTLNADGSFTYDPPNATFTGSDTFTYTATNGQTPPNATDAQATVTIHVDAPPSVTSTTPTNGATDQATSANISITFSEAVNVTGSWFTLSCSTSGSHTAAVTGGPTTFILNPDTDFTQGETCTVTVLAAQVSDQDTNDPPDNLDADFVFSFTMDAAPSVSSTSPTNGATGVATNSNIAVNFSESVNAGGSSFAISCANSGSHTFALSASPSSSFTINPNADFSPNELCTVTVVAANTTDADTNDPPNNMMANYVFSFTTDAAPSVSTTSPVNGATGVATNTNIVINFSENVNATTSSFTIECPAPGNLQSYTVSGSGTSSITLDPVSNLPEGMVCTVTVLANQISDTDANDPPDNMLANYVFSFTTDTAPTVTTTTPTNGATQVAANTDIVVNFSENVNIADASAFTVQCPVGSPVAFSVTPAAPGATNSFTIDPASDLPFGAVCTVTVVASKVTDADANDPPDNMAANFVFSFTVDQVPTVTTTTPANNSLSNSKSTNITINFSENVGVTAGGVTVNCGAGNLTFSGLPQTNVSSIVVDPTANLVAGSTCTVTVLSANVTDADTGDPPNNLDGDNNGTEGGDYVFTFGVAPDAVDDTHNATGNIGVVVPANGVLANDVGAGAVVDRVGPTTANNVVPNGGSFTSATAQGGSVTLASDGSYTYVPPVGKASGTDTFKYRISNAGGVSGDATVTITITGIVWFICDACGGSNQGTLQNPYTSINSFSTNNTGAANKPSAGQRIFIRSGTYDASNDNLTLLNTQIVSGQGQAATSFFIAEAPAPAAYASLTASTRPVIAPTSGNGVTLASGNTLSFFNIGSNISGTCAAGSSPTTGTLLTGSTVGSLTIGNMNVSGCGRAINLDTSGTPSATFDDVSSMNSSTEGMRLNNLGGTVTINAGAIQTATNEDIEISGDNSGDTVVFSYSGTITDDLGTLVSIANQSGGTRTFSGAITDGNDGDGGGISLTNNTGVTINFTGGLSLSTGANAAFAATGGGTVNVCDKNPCGSGPAVVNTLTTTTGTALNVASTTIGASGFTFKSISANGAANGILLNNTGASGGLTVTGDGNTSVGGNSSGGTIQNTTANGIRLINTTSPSFTNINISNTTGSGIKGSSNVVNFTLKNSTISGSNDSALDGGVAGENTTDESNVAFNDNLAPGTQTNLTGTVNISDNSLTTALYHGIDLFNNNGTISDVTISNNTITSTTSTVTSKGTGIRLVAFGSSSTIANVTKATISGNTVSNFPQGAGIMAQGGNGNAAGPAGVFGTAGHATNKISITGNTVNGGATKFATQAILAVVNGKGQGNFDISSNPTVTNCIGTAIAVSSLGSANVTANIKSNVIVANNTIGSSGIGAGTSSTFGTSDTPTLTVTIESNNVSQTDGNGILVTARDCTGNVNATIKSNTVAAPLGGIRPGIRIDAGNAVSIDDEVCLDIQSNTSAGSGGSDGIGLRKQGTTTTTNDFGVEGMAATSSPGVESYVDGLNPAGGGTLLISATSGFSGCSSAPLLFSGDGIEREFGRLSTVAELHQEQLDAIVEAAEARWIKGGLTPQQVTAMREVRFQIGELGKDYLAEAAGKLVVIDRDAQSMGWYVDTTPLDDSEFGNSNSLTRRFAKPLGAPAGHVDLLTAIGHEIGHKLGLIDSYSDKDRDNIMYGYLTPGERRVPWVADAVKVGLRPLAGSHFLKLKELERSEFRSREANSGTATVGSRTHHAAPVNSAPLSGETVNYTIGTLPAGKHVRIVFKVTVDSPFSGSQVSNQGTVTGTLNAAPVNIVTDDPDAGGASDPTLTPVVSAPDAVDDNYNAFKNTPLNIAAPGVLTNDTNGPTVSAISGCGDVTSPYNCTTTQGGTIVVNSDGSFSYTPPSGSFTGADSFTYTATNAVGSDTATVNITVLDTSAIFINEVLFNPDGTGTNEYIELRGPASTVIPAGTYFVVVDGDAGTTAGDVTTIISLSGLSFGTNGFLVLLQNGHTYTTMGGTVVSSTTTGFGGLPGAPWQADGGVTSLEDSGATFMLIQTGTAPTLSDDIDANDDGTPDGTVYAGWSVRDSVGHVAGGNANDRGYGAINYITNAVGTGSGTVVTPGFIPVYVGRICDSTGSAGTDWVASGTLGGSAPNWTLGSNASPANFAGKALNHIGASNFANLAPANSVPGAQAVNEDGTLTLNAGNTNLISISDADAGTAAMKVTLTAGNGVVTLSGVSGLSFTTGDGTADGSMIFTGTIANINTALNGMTFSPASNYFGAASLQIVTEDQGNTGCGGNQTDSDTINITVNGVNDEPSFAIAANPVAVNEDAGAQTVSSFATSISQGPGESGQILTFNVSVSGGTGNLAFTNGPAIDSTTGTLTYTPAPNTNGTATFNVTLSDNGSSVSPNSNTSGAQQFTITVNAVNDAPTFLIPNNPPAVNEDGGAQTVNSFATNFQPGPVTATDENTQTLVGYTLTQAGSTGNLTFSSGPAISNAGTLTYTPTNNTSGTVTFNVVATDSGSGTSPNVNQSAPVSFTITVNGQNDAPVLDNSGNMFLSAINEDVANASNPGTLVSAIIASAEPPDRITDVDAGALEGIAVTTVDNTNGTWQFSIDNGTNWTAFGSPSNTVARLLAANANTRVRFLPNANFNGTVGSGLTFRAWDQTSGTNGTTADPSTNGGTSAFSMATEVASITVNPINDQPAANGQTVGTNEDTPVGIVLTGSDVETASGNLSFTVTVQPLHGMLSGSGANRTYTPPADYNGPDSFTFTVTDTGDGVSPSLTSPPATVNINVGAVNDAPTANPQSVSTNEDTPKTITLTGSDVDTPAGSLSYLIVSGPSHGTLDPGTSANRTYTPTGNYNGPDSFTFKLNDGSADSNIATVSITVNPINDQPTANAQSPSTNEDTPLGITLTGSDTETPAANLTFNVTVQPTHGVLSGAGANRTYTPDANYNGSDSFKFTVTDTGDGSSPALTSAEATVSLTVNAINDAPVNTVPVAQTVAQNGSLTFSAANGNQVSIADIDAGTNSMRVQLTATNGTISLNGTAGLSFTVGDGTADPTMTFTGSVININGALNGVTFTPMSGFNGAASLQIVTNDQGNTGTGGAQSDTDSVNINVTPAALISLSASNYNVNESEGSLAINVNRAGDSSGAVTIDYATSDNSGPASVPCSSTPAGQASSRCDFNSVFGTLRFAAGENTKTILIPITRDSFAEGGETFTIALSHPTGPNATLVVPSNASITINDSAPPASNAIDDTDTFVRQHYHDFLNREADPVGLAFWKDNIDKCNDSARRPAGLTVGQCIEVFRIRTSAAFFLSIEFRQTGGLVRDFYVAALDRPATNNMPSFVEFTRDTQAVQAGVIVGQGNWQATLDNNRAAFMNDFVMRAEFVGLYPTTDTPTQYVDKLFLHAAVTPTAQERADAISEFGGAATASDPTARGRALLLITQHQTFQTRELNRAFVQMEYFGYLRRNPNDLPDIDFSGYNFWLNKLNAFNGDFFAAEMVKAFISSSEYRRRFGP